MARWGSMVVKLRDGSQRTAVEETDGPGARAGLGQEEEAGREGIRIVSCIARYVSAARRGKRCFSWTLGGTPGRVRTHQLWTRHQSDC
jgi:hypothetical protein